MTLQTAYIFFESLKIETTNNCEIKVYNKFLHILTGLKIREFSKDEIQSLETELVSLNLKSNPANRKRYFNKALNKFEKHLKDRFSLTPKGYYTNRGVGLGCSFGILFGIIVLSRFERSLGLSLGLIFGMLLGLIIGRAMDAKAISENRVL
jgi:hypothetical protein